MWKVCYYTDKKGNETIKDWIKDWIKSLEKKTQLKIFNAIELLKTFGIFLREPYVKHIETKLYELRIKDYNGIYRIFYCIKKDKVFMLLHGFIKKTNKTPKKKLILLKKGC